MARPATAAVIGVWHLYRRPKDSDASWEQYAGVKGDKRAVIVAMQEIGQYVANLEYDFLAMPGDERPTWRPKWAERGLAATPGAWGW
jgi:hypothetical protein